MDLIRLIKLKKLNGDLDNLSEQEECFLSFFNGLKKKNTLYFNINDDLYFKFNENSGTFYYSYIILYKVFYMKFNYTEIDINKLIVSTFKNRLGINNINTFATTLTKKDWYP